MHLDRGIVHMDRRSDGPSMRPDGLNTLTCQNAYTKYAHWDLPSWTCYNILNLPHLSQHHHNLCQTVILTPNLGHI